MKEQKGYTQKKRAELKKRYDFIDGIRGIALLNMVVYHFLYNVYIVYEKDLGWYRRPEIYLWQQGICWTFILIAGISIHFSRNNWKRGMVALGSGWIITLGTVLFMPQQAIHFGVISFIGTAILIVELSKKLWAKCNSSMGFYCSMLLYFFTRRTAQGYFGLGDFFVVDLPDFLYERKGMAFLGFPSESFHSSDYFPVLPWLFLFLAGYYLWLILKPYAIVQTIGTKSIPYVSKIGKKTLLIYFLHQPICLFLCYLLFGQPT